MRCLRSIAVMWPRCAAGRFGLKLSVSEQMSPKPADEVLDRRSGEFEWPDRAGEGRGAVGRIAGCAAVQLTRWLARFDAAPRGQRASRLGAKFSVGEEKTPILLGGVPWRCADAWGTACGEAPRLCADAWGTACGEVPWRLADARGTACGEAPWRRADAWGTACGEAPWRCADAWGTP
jgi:hypothetical protein